MPVEEVGQAHDLVRLVKTVRGEVRYRMRCAPRFDYARASHTVEVREPDEFAVPVLGPTSSRCGCARACR